MNDKVKAAIIGPGNIGTDLLVKAKRSEIIDPLWMVGVLADSPGLARARELGLKTTAGGVEACLEQLEEDGVQIAFDATSAAVHADNARLLNGKGIQVIDLTPAAIGPYCIPSINPEQHLDAAPMNLNMVTCGGQATIPIVAAVSRVQPVSYGEIVATVASKSVGPGTRKNIDEFTRTTAAAIEALGGAERGKAIIVINPAEPPLIMRDTIHCLTATDPDCAAIEASVRDMVATVQQYVPGYTLKNGPIFDGRRVTVWMEVEGNGDFLPKYAGNLDIMTAAALRTAELQATRMLAQAAKRGA